jgi:hypothetical protein
MSRLTLLLKSSNPVHDVHADGVQLFLEALPLRREMI